MQASALTQFKLGDDGIIRFQPDSSNPLPGEPVARLIKGEKILEPKTEVLETGGHDKDAVGNLLNEWLKAYIRTALEPLPALEVTEGLADPVKGICEKLYNALGIIPREDVQALTQKLDPEMRQVLRGKQIRLGPVLVFMPALNKPAGVKLRGLLWSLWNDKPLPPPLPHAGVVSVRVDEAADRDFYRAIGYPIYGPRAIRIDMLDRVINAIYDGAKDGKFQAQHKMAEWLGCPIDDLYLVLVAMGHRKLDDAPQAVATETAATEAPVETAIETPAPEAAPVVEEKQPEEATTAEKPAEEAKVEEKAAVVRPELAFFSLKKGKASGDRGPRKPRAGKREPKVPPPPDWIDKEAKGDYKKPERKKPDGKGFKRDGKNKDRDYNKERGKHNRDQHRPVENARLAGSASAKTTPDDSPFAILSQLKKAKDGA